jgi:putative SOS response-associated peptidase YedK
MCGRYFFDGETAEAISEELDFDPESVSMSPGDVTPAMSPIVFSASKGEETGICIRSMFWGIAGKDKKMIINARAESIQDKAMFSDAFKSRRLIIPVSGFYEWDKDRNKVIFFRKDKSPIYLAGVYSLYDNKDSFAILTTAANESMIKVHDRMPLMIERQYVRDWLYNSIAAEKMLSEKMPLLDSRQDYEQLSLF